MYFLKRSIFERKRWRDIYELISPQMATTAKAKWKVRVWNSIRVSYRGARVPSIWAFCYCMSRELDGRWSSQDSHRLSAVGTIGSSLTCDPDGKIIKLDELVLNTDFLKNIYINVIINSSIKQVAKNHFHCHQYCMYLKGITMLL